MRFLSRNFASLTIDLKSRSLSCTFFDQDGQPASLKRTFDGSVTTRVDIEPSKGNKWWLNFKYQVYQIFWLWKVGHVLFMLFLVLKSAAKYGLACVVTFALFKFVSKSLKK